jgi:SagB-type dehydrogenase family enzyme
VARPWRSMRKYGSRGVRYVFVEAGAIAQCVHLAAEALGVGTVDCASVYEDEAGDVMGIDGLFEQLVHTVVVGYSG